MTAPTGTRYSWGGDEHLDLQVSEAMTLEANFTAMAISDALSEMAIPGVVDICPANASLLLRFDPDVIHPRRLEATVREIEREVGAAPTLSLKTRIFEVPV
jgi:urea carboxylase